MPAYRTPALAAERGARPAVTEPAARGSEGPQTLTHGSVIALNRNVDRPSSASLQASPGANRKRFSVRSNSGRRLASSRRPRIIAMICSPGPQPGEANSCSCACVILPGRESLQIPGGNCRGRVAAGPLIAAPESPFPLRNVFISRGISGVHFNEILPLQVLNGKPFNLMAIDL